MNGAPYTLRHDIVLETKAMDGTISEEVLRPAGETVLVRRPRAKDLKVVDEFANKPIALSLAMIAKLSNLDGLAVDNLDAEDLAGLGELLAGFMPGGLPTGAIA